MGHSVHAEGHFLFWVLVKLLPHRKCLGNHLALLDPLGFIVTAADNSGTGTKRQVRQGRLRVIATPGTMRGRIRWL